jgi:hypothetical protein
MISINHSSRRQEDPAAKMRGFNFHTIDSTMTQYIYQRASILTLCSLLCLNANGQVQPDHPVTPLVQAETVSRISDRGCRAIAQRSDQYRDGRYWLQVRGKAVLLYCHDMAGEPREYLELPEGNCSEYTSLMPGIRRVRTCFQRVRLDTDTLRVDIGDLTFSQTSRQGTIPHGQMVVDAMPYATAMSCDAPGFPAGKAGITLTGTDFGVINTFKPQGYRATGYVNREGGEQTLELRGGGYCGWMAPDAVYNPFYAPGWNPLKNTSGFLLQLRMLSDRH